LSYRNASGVRSIIATRRVLVSPIFSPSFCAKIPPNIMNGSRMTLMMKLLVFTAAAYSRMATTRLLRINYSRIGTTDEHK
jgi:hypothetical protein